MKSIAKLLLRVLKAEFYYYAFFVLLSLLWMGVAPHFYAIITNGFSKFWLESFYNLFNNNLLLNIPVCIFLMYVCIKWVKRVYSDKSICFRHITLFLFVFILLYYKSPFEYAMIVWGIDYREFILSLLFCLICLKVIGRTIEIIKLFFFVLFFVLGLLLFNHLSPFGNANGKCCFDNNREIVLMLFICICLFCASLFQLFNSYLRPKKKYDSGFSPDYNENIEYPDSLKKYANSIVSRLLGTDLRKESFAVGITSEWGAGKTTFLRLLKNNIGNRADVVEFNPWMCRTPDQLTNDFFSSLSHQLSKRDSSFSRPIKKYARYLNAISFPASNFFSIKFSNIASEVSLFERKKKLSEKFLKLNKPVIVMIDDIDRLERDEVFEVLRLIRNTADLCNVIYLVAYDKNYVTSVLNEKRNIKDASIYMEKIFQIEIQLPMVQDKSIWETFLSELKKQMHSLNVEFDFSLQEQQLILSILNTYRRAKRFARLFSLNYSYLRETSSLLEWRDVFWLDLLQMHNKTIYDTLCYNRKKLLKIEGNMWIFKGKNSQLIDDTDDKTYEILNCLWGENNNFVKNVNSICYTESFNKYFTLQFQRIEEEIISLIDSNNIVDFEEIITEKNVDLNYLWIEMCKVLKKSTLDEKQLKNMLCYIFTICYYCNEFAIGRMLNDIKDIYKDISELELYVFLSEWLSKKLLNGGNRFILSVIVGEIAANNLLKRDEVLLLIQSIMKDYIDKEYFTVYDLSNYNSEINKLIRYLFLHSSECEYGGQQRRQDAFNYIIDNLASKGKRVNLDGYLQKSSEMMVNTTFKYLYDDNWKDNLKMLEEKLVVTSPELHN